MAEDLLIQPLVLDPADFPPLPLQPGFMQLVSDEQGDAGTPADGFDAVMAEVTAIVDALDGALGGLGLELLDAFAEADLIDAAPVSDTVAGFTASLAVSSKLNDQLGTLLGTAAPPTPPVHCDLTINLPDVSGNTLYALGVSNVGQINLTITAAVFKTAAPDILSVAIQVPQTIFPNGELAGSIQVTAARLGSFSATLTVTSPEAGTAVFCYNVNVVQVAAPSAPPVPRPIPVVTPQPPGAPRTPHYGPNF